MRVRLYMPVSSFVK